MISRIQVSAFVIRCCHCAATLGPALSVDDLLADFDAEGWEQVCGMVHCPDCADMAREQEAIAEAKEAA